MTLTVQTKQAPMKHPWGVIQGTVTLPASVISSARDLSKEYFRQAAAQDFCGDPVEDLGFPSWMGERRLWINEAELRVLGFAPASGEQLLATVSVDPHVDAIHGPVMALVLHNDGLTFKQGRVSHKTAVGEWFIFDDRKPHQVRESKKSTTYLLWSLPLRELYTRK